MDVQWFKKRMKEVRVTQVKLGEAFGRDRSKVSRIFGGQKMTVEDAKIFAKELDVPLGVVLQRAGIADGDGLPLIDTFIPLEVVGYVQAGLWRGADAIDETMRRTIMVPRINGARQLFALEVRGDSMNEILKPGSVIVCQSIHEYVGEVENELLVVVERHDHGQVETTVKELFISNGRYSLVPRSSNKSHAPIEVPPPEEWDGMDGQGVRILGVVVQAFQNMLPGR